MRSILELCSAEAYDEGEYSCVASSRYNPSRNTSAQFYVDVVTLQGMVRSYLHVLGIGSHVTLYWESCDV